MKISALFVFFLFISCSQNKPVIEVIYTINEFSTEDNRINVTLDITNKTIRIFLLYGHFIGIK